MTQTLVTIVYHTRLLWGWKEGSLVKSAHCSCRGPEFGPQHPHPAVHSCLDFMGLLPYLHLTRTNPYKTNAAEDPDSVSECPVIHGTTISSPPKSREHQKRSGKNVKAGGRAEGRADVWAPEHDCRTPERTATVITHTRFPENWSCQYHQRREWESCTFSGELSMLL